MKLKNYWPKREQVNHCVASWAESSSESVLLAVHREMKFTNVVSGKETEKSENELLDTFLSPNVPSGALIMPILGASGIGKTHVIRWLEAQIHRREDASRFYVIRIPKTASLRKVVELILEPLKDTPSYKKIRTELKDAVLQVTQADVITRFVAELTNQIRTYEEQARVQHDHELSLNEIDSNKIKKLKSEIGIAERIPFLFTDNALQKYFNEKVFSRLIKRSFSGSTSEVDTDELPQFDLEDFNFPKEVIVDNAAKEVSDYIRRYLNISNTSQKEKIVAFLNSYQLIDRALKRAYNISGDFGGKTIDDLVSDIRNVMLEEDKELILLIEDYAVLSGVQETLLNVATHEGIFAGKKVRATMRTAIAVTDGYQMTDTVTTRAKNSWRIQSRKFENNDDIHEEITDMVGAYLNAARWGKEKLDEKYKSATGNSNWVGIFEDDDIDEAESRTLTEFGFSKSKFPLFPFNKTAIKTLSVNLLRDDTGTLVFNPRSLMDKIITPILLARDDYKNGSFPIQFEGVTPNRTVATFSSKISGNDKDKERLRSLLSVWGGNPDNDRDLSTISPVLFSAFSVAIPNEITGTPSAKQNEVNKQNIKEEIDKKKELRKELNPGPTISDPEFSKWEKELENWVLGNRMTSKSAAHLRTIIAETVNHHVQWDIVGLPVRFKKGDLVRTISIPNAAGEGTGRSKTIAVCEDYKDPDGKVRQALCGIYRYHKNKLSWNYEEGQKDFLHTVDMIERIANEWTRHLLDEQQKLLNVLSKNLHLQALILGMGTTTSTKPFNQFLKSLLSTADPSFYKQNYDPDWNNLSDVILKEKDTSDSWRKRFQDKMLEHVVTIQGSKSGPKSIDFAKIVSAFESERLKEERQVHPEFSDYFNKFNWRLVTRQAMQLKKKITDDHEKISELIGDIDTFDFSNFIKLVQDLEQKLVDLNCFPGPRDVNLGSEELRLLLEDGSNLPIETIFQSMENICKLTAAEPGNDVFKELGDLNLKDIKKLVELFLVVEKICAIGKEKVLAIWQSSDAQNVKALEQTIEQAFLTVRDFV